MFNTLVSVDELAAHLDDPHWIVFDCRHDLVDTESGRRAYAQSHVPGARFLHLDEDLSGAKTGANGRHPLPDPAWFCARLSALGMDNGKQAIAYDASGGFYAARLWWMLGWVGHAGAAVLDGGWNAWSNAKHPFKAHAPTITPGVFDGAARDYTLTADAVRTGLRQSRICLIDARAPDRFRGENETLDPVGGHIPGAVNRFFKENLAVDGHFKPAAELQREFSVIMDARPAREIVHQCGSGVTACHNLLAMEIAGLHGSRLYPGSWSEWCSDPRRATARDAGADNR